MSSVRQSVISSLKITVRINPSPAAAGLDVLDNEVLEQW
jgi:hypothetical protein